VLLSTVDAEEGIHAL